MLGAIKRMEIRGWLRSLSQSERDKITQASELDPQIKQAVIESPREMTGIAPSHHHLISESVMREMHGPLLDEVRELERGIDVATSAVEIGRDELRLESGLNDPREFDRRAAAFEQKLVRLGYARKVRKSS